jgi:hypothetical protein
MNPEYLDVEANTWITKDYPIDHDLDVNTLTEIYIIVYLLERKGRDPEEIYTFTTDFEQAFKRFKLLPNTQGFLKRILTDDDNLIALAKEGTKPKIDPSDPRLAVEEKIEDVTMELEDTHIE